MKKGDIINLILRGVLRERADPADLHHGSSDRDLSAYQEETRAIRHKVERFELLHQYGWEMCKRILRVKRSGRPA